MEIYASPGPKPSLEFQHGLEGGSDLLEKLERCLPLGARIELELPR
jgi:hypothetical protein